MAGTRFVPQDEPASELARNVIVLGRSWDSHVNKAQQRVAP
jgi:hypothetical protein